MRVIVNDEPLEVAEGATVATLVAGLGLDPRRVAVEVNRRLVRRADHAGTALAAGDAVELVTLVGGGSGLGAAGRG